MEGGLWLSGDARLSSCMLSFGEGASRCLASWRLSSEPSHI